MLLWTIFLLGSVIDVTLVCGEYCTVDPDAPPISPPTLLPEALLPGSVDSLFWRGTDVESLPVLPSQNFKSEAEEEVKGSVESLEI